MTENGVTREEEYSADLKNEMNTIDRWEKTLQFYQKTYHSLQQTRSEEQENNNREKCRCLAIIDVSGSMEGRKLIAVKLGICSLIGNLNEDDEVHLLAFSEECRSISDGYVRVSTLLPQLPRLLAKINVHGGTAFYDAIIHGMKEQYTRHHHQETSQDDKNRVKNVMTILTDGEDFDSRSTPRDVERYLLSPGVPHFMFILVAVAMTSREEQLFSRWLELTHCKQVSVTVRTGNSLVGIFREMLLGRILQTPLSSNRFLQIESSELPSDANRELTATALSELRTQLIRPFPPSFVRGVGEEEEDGDELMARGDLDDDHLSCGISRVDSMSSSGDNDLNFDFDYGLRHSGTYGGRSPGSISDSNYSDIEEIEMEREFNTAGRNGDIHIMIPSNSLPLNAIKEDEEDLEVDGTRYPQEFYCPILHKVMRDPVLSEDGHTYEREAITQWFQHNQTSPLTNNPLSSTTLIPNHALRSVIETAKEQRKGQRKEQRKEGNVPTASPPPNKQSKEDSKKDGCRIM